MIEYLLLVYFIIGVLFYLFRASIWRLSMFIAYCIVKVQEMLCDKLSVVLLRAKLWFKIKLIKLNKLKDIKW